MGFFIELFSNEIFLSAMVAIAISQFLKMVITSIKKRKFTPLAIFNLAGMPSSHMAAVTAPLTMIYLEEGMTTAFLVMLAVVIILFDDLISVDRSIGVHARIINSFLEIFPGKIKYKPVRTAWGHNLSELIVGIFLGYIIGYVGWTLA